MSQPELMMSLSTACALLALQPYAVEARYEARPFRWRPAGCRFWRWWSSFGVGRWSSWRRVEMVAVVMKLNEELEGLDAEARALEATIAANLAEIMEA